MTKSAAIVPVKCNSERVPEKNFRKINGKPLYQYMLSKLNECDFDSIYVDTDSDEIKEYSIKNKINVIDRVPELAGRDANGNDLLNYHASIIDADIYFQLFVTAPLLSKESINRCVQLLKNNKQYDSVFTVEEIYSWFWFGRQPINYDPKKLPRSQDATPMIRETTGLYGIRREALISGKCRIGGCPFLMVVPEGEAVDLDTESDFSRLEYFL